MQTLLASQEHTQLAALLVLVTVWVLVWVMVSWLELLTINRRSCTITEKAPTRTTTALTFKTLLLC